MSGPLSPSSPDKLIKVAEVLKRCALSRSSPYAYMKDGSFPRQVRQSVRSVAWSEQEVIRWIEARKIAR